MALKFRCTGCGKSIIASEAHAGEYLLCRACGTWVEVPADAADSETGDTPAAPPPAPKPAQAEESVLRFADEEEEQEKRKAAERDGWKSTAPPAVPPPASAAPVQPANVPGAVPAARPAAEPPHMTELPGVAEKAALAAREEEQRFHEAQMARNKRIFIWKVVGGICASTLLIGLLIVFITSRDPWERKNRAQLLALKEQSDALARQGKLAEALEGYEQIRAQVGGRHIKDGVLHDEVDAALASRERLSVLVAEKASQRPGPRVPPAAIANGTPQPQPRAQVPASTQPSPAGVAQGPALTTQPVVAAGSRRPPARTSVPPARGVSDKQIGDAIKRAVDFLLTTFEDGKLKRAGNPDWYVGQNALCVYALLQAGQATGDARLSTRGTLMRNMIDRMKGMSMDTMCQTYARGIRATALAVSNRPEDRAALAADVAWLLSAYRNGAYGYSDPGDVAAWDNSNSQYGVLGVWSGSEAGITVPQDYWIAMQEHWTQCQFADGQWGYAAASSDPRCTMTMAGLATLFVTHDYLDAPRFGSRVGRPPFSPALARGLAWLEQGDNCLEGRTWMHRGYALYGLERVGLASGFKYFGAHDWYREIAADIMSHQAADGSVGDLVETAYSVLFLARGRHPILMNKLRFDGAWANRPRDVSNLARFASRELERPLNWQVVPLDRDWTEWTDCPVLYMSSHEPPAMKEADRLKLKQFAEAGGLIYSQADGNSASFTEWVQQLGRSLFPGLDWVELPPNNEVCAVHFKIRNPPRLYGLSNGSRLLMLHSAEDLSQHWQTRSDKSHRDAFELGVNVFLYAAGKADLNNRLASTYLPPPTGTGYQLRMARIKYPGAWDPEPHAFERFRKWMAYQTGYSLEVATVEASELRPEEYPVAHLTGTDSWTPGDAMIEALRKYVEAGGILVMDACGGSTQFDESVAQPILSRAFPGSKLQTLSAEHPILAGNADGMDPMPKPLLRSYAEVKLGKAAARIYMLKAEKGIVLYSPMDMTTGLLGTSTWTVMGFRPGYAQSFFKNVLLWAADQK